jgi:hypothetical protein
VQAYTISGPQMFSANLDDEFAAIHECRSRRVIGAQIAHLFA